MAIYNPNPGDPYIQSLVQSGWTFNAATNSLDEPAPAMGTPYTGAPPPPVDWAANQITPPGSSSTGTLAINPNTGLPLPAIAPSVGYNNPVAAQWEANQNLLTAQQQLLGWQGAQLQARQMAMGAQQPVYDAQLAAMVPKNKQLAAEKKALDAQRAYLNEQQRNAEATRKEYEEIRAAEQDPDDILRVARIKRDRQNYAYRFSIAGLNQPIEVDLPEGWTGKLPPGIVQRVETLAEILTEKAKDAEFMRRFNEEALRLRMARYQADVQEAGHDVERANMKITEAQINARKYDLLIEEAELAVAHASLNVNYARLAVDAASMPPSPGLVWDDQGAAWVTRAELEARQQQRQLTEGGPLGPGAFSADGLVNMLADNIINEAQFREEMARRGYLPGSIDAFVGVANSRRDKPEEGAGNWDAVFGGGLQPGAAAAPAPQPTGPQLPGPIDTAFNWLGLSFT